VADEEDENLTVETVRLGAAYPKYAFLKRYFADRQYVKILRRRITQFAPDIILSGNASPMIQRDLLDFCRTRSVRFVNWVQDCYWVAAAKRFSQQAHGLGKLVTGYIRRTETHSIISADGVVLISEDFYQAFPSAKSPRTVVIENWAPLDQLRPLSKSNSCSIPHGLADKKVFLYSGTLGLKHNPELLVQLALHLQARPGVVVVVISEGLGRAYIEQRKAAIELRNLFLYDFQPFELMSEVLASADVLVATIEKAASAFSVPSKILTYLCSRRPLLLAVPIENAAAQIVKNSRAGIVVEPSDPDGFLLAADKFIEQPAFAAACAERARQYAVDNFEIGAVADRFERVLLSACFGDKPLGQYNVVMRRPRGLEPAAFDESTLTK